MGVEISLLLQKTGFVHDIREWDHRRKHHQGLSDKKTSAITPQGGASTREAGLYDLSYSLKLPQASVPPYCCRQDSSFGKQTLCPRMHCLVSLILIFSWFRLVSGEVSKCHLIPWRGQSVRPAQNTWTLQQFSLLAFSVACYGGMLQWTF